MSIMTVVRRPLLRASANARRSGDQVARGASVAVLFAVVGMTLAANWIAPSNPFTQDLAHQFLPASKAHPFGSDEFGRDLLSRVIYGARISVITATGVLLTSGVIGVPLGLVSGFNGGQIDAVIMRSLDALLALPSILLAMGIVAILGANTLNAMVALSIVSIPAFARLTRASTLALKEREFVLAARSVGAGTGYLLFRTILPTALPPLIVQSAVTASNAILLEAGLSFLGLGARPPEPSWGSLLSSGRSFLRQSPWYGLFPGIAITAVVLEYAVGQPSTAVKGTLSAVTRYVVKRILQAVPVLLITSIAVWL